MQKTGFGGLLLHVKHSGYPQLVHTYILYINISIHIDHRSSIHWRRTQICSIACCCTVVATDLRLPAASMICCCTTAMQMHGVLLLLQLFCSKAIGILSAAAFARCARDLCCCAVSRTAKATPLSQRGRKKRTQNIKKM